VEGIHSEPLHENRKNIFTLLFAHSSIILNAETVMTMRNNHNNYF